MGGFPKAMKELRRFPVVRGSTQKNSPRDSALIDVGAEPLLSVEATSGILYLISRRLKSSRRKQSLPRVVHRIVVRDVMFRKGGELEEQVQAPAPHPSFFNQNLKVFIVVVVVGGYVGEASISPSLRSKTGEAQRAAASRPSTYPPTMPWSPDGFASEGAKQEFVHVGDLMLAVWPGSVGEVVRNLRAVRGGALCPVVPIPVIGGGEFIHSGNHEKRFRGISIYSRILRFSAELPVKIRYLPLLLWKSRGLQWGFRGTIRINCEGFGD
jgi:hypothetical protein